MTPRMSGLLAAILVALTPTFAGCMDPSTGAGANADEASMAELHAISKVVAQGWRTNAVLTSAAAVEEGKSVEESEWDEFDLPWDPAVGNGRAVAWMFEFVDPATADSLSIAIAAHDRSVLAMEEDDGNEVPTAITWGIDSGDAARIAKANADFKSAVRDLKDPTYWFALEADDDEFTPGDEERPRWMVIAFDGYDDDVAAYAVIDAHSGDVLAAGDWSFDADEWSGFSSGKTHFERTWTKELTARDPHHEYWFPVEEQGVSIGMRTCTGQRVPGGTVRYEVKTPSGVVLHTYDQDARGSSQTSFGTSETGSHTVSATLVDGVATDYLVEVVVFSGGSFDTGEPISVNC